MNYYFQFFRDELQNTDGFERQSIFHGKDKQISVRDLWHAWKKSAGMYISSIGRHYYLYSHGALFPASFSPGII